MSSFFLLFHFFYFFILKNQTQPKIICQVFVYIWAMLDTAMDSSN